MIKQWKILFTITLCAFAASNAGAAVVSRPSPSRATTTSRMPSIAAIAQQPTTTSTTTANDTPEQTMAPTPDSVEDTVIIEDKSARFSTTLNQNLTSDSDTAGADLAEMIRAQRAALDAADNVAAPQATSTRNNCDTGLRECMTTKCGKDFLKCTSDTDTIFGGKLDTCRRNLKCSATEFKLFSAEIKSDRSVAIKLKSFNDIIDCGQRYDSCIIGECGATYARCLGKSAGDAAIAKCGTIARNCTQMDSGLANRTMNVFATLRQTAEKQIASDEKKLYALRDQMKSVCSRLGAMFDERSLDCVYTINFYAGPDSTLYASKKAYAGSTFTCTPNWFGVDVTTYMENANRLTREQTAASSAMLGSGVGMGVGAITSGAINNAIDRQNAKDALDERKCSQEPNMKWNSFLGKCVKDNSADKENDKAVKEQTKAKENAEKKAQSNQGTANTNKK